MIPSWIKPGIWGVVIGALGWWAVLALGLGWMSPGNAKQLAENQTQAAVVAVATPNCVARFEQQANAVASWQALKKADADYDRSDYIKKNGFAAVAGQKPDSTIASAVADACATQLLALKQLNGVKLSSAQ